MLSFILLLVFSLAEAFVVLSHTSNSRQLLSLLMTQLQPQLWLDLRNTQLAPTMAVERLERDLEIDNLVDRVVVGADVDSSSHVVVTDDGVIHSSDVQGRVVQMLESGILQDPLQVIEDVSKGKWIIIEFSKEQQHQAVESLLQLVTGAVATSSSHIVGGIAWPCQTAGQVLQAGFILQSLGSVQSTLSGILLSSKNKDFKLQCAWLLPFDEKLWKTAVLVLQEPSLQQEEQ
jgi:predicted RecA/RadA family phage recombinase